MPKGQAEYWKRYEHFDAVVREHGGDMHSALHRSHGVDAEHAILKTSRKIMAERGNLNIYTVVGTGRLDIPTASMASAEPSDGEDGKDFYLRSSTFSRFRAYDGTIHETRFNVQDLGEHGLRSIPPPVFSRNELREGRDDTVFLAVRDAEATKNIDRALERGGYDEKPVVLPKA